MTEEELELLKNIVDRMADGDLSRQDKILLVLGLQAGLNDNDGRVKEQINRVADLCLVIDAEYDVADIKSFDN